jgi:lipopolysaccharide biosynthesis regulator YciM
MHKHDITNRWQVTHRWQRHLQVAEIYSKNQENIKYQYPKFICGITSIQSEKHTNRIYACELIRHNLQNNIYAS